MTIDIKATKKITIIAGIADSEFSRLAFNTWFEQEPGAARDWLNRKLENAERNDANLRISRQC